MVCEQHFQSLGPAQSDFALNLRGKIFFAAPIFPSIFAPHRIRRVTIMCAAWADFLSPANPHGVAAFVNGDANN